MYVALLKNPDVAEILSEMMELGVSDWGGAGGAGGDMDLGTRATQDVGQVQVQVQAGGQAAPAPTTPALRGRRRP